eukprot:scaffold3911_cov36-Tisochrysis_lutea.AAC.3
MSKLVVGLGCLWPPPIISTWGDDRCAAAFGMRRLCMRPRRAVDWSRSTTDAIQPLSRAAAAWLPVLMRGATGRNSNGLRVATHSIGRVVGGLSRLARGGQPI